MNGRTPNVEEQIWLDKCHQVPCLACMLFHDIPDSPAEYHHTRGQRKPGAHFLGFSLCTKHHRISDHQHPKRWISRHGDGRTIFQAKYMQEGAFVEEQRREVTRLESQTV